MSNQISPFDAVLGDLAERDRDEVIAAFAAVENSPDPVPEVLLKALRDATLRRSLEMLLRRIGRTLVRVDATHWTSGYRDQVVAELSADGLACLPAIDRAVLVLVLIHSVAIPRTEGLVGSDTWVSPVPTPRDEILRFSRLPRVAATRALARLRSAGLIESVGSEAGTSYIPGPQFHRLTPAAKRRLQDRLILAAGPDTPLAAAIRARTDLEAQ